MKKKYNIFAMIFFIFCISIILVVSYGNAMDLILEKNHLEAYTLIVAIIGLFATFGGAYLGAKMSGDATLEATQKQIDHQINMKLKQSNAYVKRIIEEVFKTLKSYRDFDILINSNTPPFNLEKPYIGTARNKTFPLIDEYKINFLSNKLQQFIDFRNTEAFYYLDDFYIDNINNLINGVENFIYWHRLLQQGRNDGANEDNSPSMRDKRDNCYEELNVIYISSINIINQLEHDKNK